MNHYEILGRDVWTIPKRRMKSIVIVSKMRQRGCYGNNHKSSSAEHPRYNPGHIFISPFNRYVII